MREHLTSCIFCKIAQGLAPAKILYQDEQVTAFRDTHPLAPTHILVIPNRHIDSLNELTSKDETLTGHLLSVARLVAQQDGIDQDGYRLIINTGIDGGQTVFHLHVHVIGGQRMRFPMG